METFVKGTCGSEAVSSTRGEGREERAVYGSVQVSPQRWDSGAGEGERVEEREEGRGGQRFLRFFLHAGALTQVCALARRFLFLPLAHGVGVTHNHFVHPGERLGEEHRTLEEAQVTSV